jgi:hypothetical protein
MKKLGKTVAIAEWLRQAVPPKGDMDPSNGNGGLARLRKMQSIARTMRRDGASNEQIHVALKGAVLASLDVNEVIDAKTDEHLIKAFLPWLESIAGSDSN